MKWLNINFQSMHYRDRYKKNEYEDLLDVTHNIYNLKINVFQERENNAEDISRNNRYN